MRGEEVAKEVADVGRQINFYMSPEDEKEFIEFIRSLGAIIIKNKSKRKIPTQYKWIQNTNKPRLDLYLWKRDDEELIFRRLKTTEGEFVYFIDNVKSLVIEFTPSFMRGNELLWGRIWAEFKYWDKDKSGKNVIIEKPKGFQSWYIKLERWIRKRYVRKGSSYYSPRVLKWKKEGGRTRVNW